jgi:uncharacterized membrane protein
VVVYGFARVAAADSLSATKTSATAASAAAAHAWYLRGDIRSQRKRVRADRPAFDRTLSTDTRVKFADGIPRLVDEDDKGPPQ